MKKATFLFLVLLAAALNAAPAVPPSPPPPAPVAPPAPANAVLRWKNGETLRGDIAAASADAVTWRTPFFEDPLQLQWSAVDRIDWPRADAAPPASFGIALRDGSFLYGDLVSITGDSISIHSTRHGDALLKRSEVLGMRRLQNDDLLYSGPMGDQGWVAMTNQPDGNVMRSPPPQIDAAPLTTGPGGSLLIRTWNRSASLDLTLPDSFAAEFCVRSSKRPQFLLSFGGNIRDSLRVETWDDDLVLTDGDQFQVLRKIDDREREVALRVLWDKKTQKCWVYTPAGELITAWQLPLSAVPATPTPDAQAQAQAQARAQAQAKARARVQAAQPLKLGLNAHPNITFVFGGQIGTRNSRISRRNSRAQTPGLVLQNRGLDLSLDFLQVRAWDGKLPAKTDAKQPRVELAGGRTVAGAISSGASGLIQVDGATPAAAAGFPIANVDAVFFSPDPPQLSDHEVTLWYNDGTTVHGSIASISNGHAAITTSFTRKPLASQLDQLRQLVIRVPVPKTAPPEPDLATLDKIVIEQTTLHGKLSIAGDGSLRWMPIGGIQAVTPSQSLSSVITRFIPQNAVPPPDPALFYLNTGDVIPGNLQSIDRSGAEIQSSIMDARKLPADELDAIEFSPSPLNVQGFNDPGWKIVKGTDKTVRRADGNLQMDAGTSIIYPSLMQSSEIRFKMTSNGGLACARLRMFCTQGDDSNSTNLLLAVTGNQFIAGTETTAGQFDNQNQIMTKPGEPVSVCLKIDENKIEILANDVSLQEIPIEPAKYTGAGLLIEPAGIWGNSIFPLALSDFSSHSTPGRTWLPEVTSEIKTQVLTVPRFERDDPPRHVLLAANGDVLRGEIEGATDSHFGFRSGLENLDVPRDRVRAVIWLKPPDANATAAPAPAASSPLDARIQMRVTFGGTGVNQYMSFIKSQVPSLNFKLPDQDNQRMVQMQIGGQTVGDALDAICLRFDLHYRVDTDGTIILESAQQQSTNDLALDSYWLKPAAFPEKPSAQEVLTAKGITFPKDSSVQWQPKSGLLAMVNTADNQAKLATLITSDFGGSLGSPTYWLQLTSGGRLPLAVDKFEGDFIEGHNPAYGSVRVPMTEVYIIRTSPPEPTTTTKSLENWRLVNAPEPAIPDGGGSESSPLLGKVASTFRLPLLAGGDFDLDDQKGRIVVLDFWASWCGPCVKSLPGLVDALAAFPSDRVTLIGVNQGEAPAQVKHFLQARGLKLTVAMDADESIGRKYGVDAIPQTIIVGQDGKVAWTQTGYDPDGDTAASATIKHLLETAPSADPPAKPPVQ